MEASDERILKTVAEIMGKHGQDDWVGPLDAALEDLGLTVDDERSLEEESWALAVLIDDRIIYVSQEDFPRDDPRRYGID